MGPIYLDQNQTVLFNDQVQFCCRLAVIVVFLLVALQLKRPGDTKDIHVLLAVRQNGVAVLSTRKGNRVLPGAGRDKGLAQEVVDVRRAVQVDQGHEWLRRERKVK